MYNYTSSILVRTIILIINSKITPKIVNILFINYYI